MGVFACGLFGWAVGWIIGVVIFLVPLLLIFVFWLLGMIVALNSPTGRKKRKEQRRQWEQYKQSPQFQQRLASIESRYGATQAAQAKSR